MKKILKPLFMSLLLLFAGEQYAQNTEGVIIGKITGALKQGVDNVNVSLLNAKDSALVKRSITDKAGAYQFTGVKTGTYLISASKTGHTTVFSKKMVIDASNIRVEAGELFITETVKTLDGVTVTARKPLIETKDDKTIFNVTEDPSLNGQMAIDALRKTPFISVDGDNNIMLNGKTNFQVQLNGKSTGLFANNPKEALQGFPANLIERIEVITNPSAKYDGEGASGILNIITKKKIMGYNGSVGIGYNSIGSRNANFSISVKKGRWGFSAFGAKGVSAQSQYGNTDYNSLLTSSLFARRYTDIHTDFRYNNAFGNGELSFEIDSLKALSAYANLRDFTNNSISDNTVTQYDRNNAVLLQSNFKNNSTMGSPTGDWGVDYIQKYKSNKEKEFSIKFNELYGNSDTYSDNAQYNSSGGDRFIVNDNSTKNTQRTLQTDFTLPLKKGNKLELGAKAILRSANSDYESLLKDLSSNQYKTDPTNSNLFNYKQDIYSIYGVYGFKAGKYSFNAGVRGEQTLITGNFISSATSVKQSFFTLLPSVSITKTINPTKRITLAYSKKLARPGINFLNPFVSNQDPLYISYGNTNLGPELIHNFELRYSSFAKGTSINLTLGENIGTRSIETFTFFDGSTGVTSTTYDNIGQNYTTNLSGFIASSLSKKIKLNTNLNLSYRALKNIRDKSINNQGIGGWGYTNISYLPSPKLNFNWSVGIYFPTIQLQGRSGMFYFYTLAGSYKMAKDKLILTLGLSTFFEEYVPNKSILKSNTFYQESVMYRPGRAFTAGLRYTFGKLKENVSKKKGVTIDDEKQAQSNTGGN
jgi:outer membrane receptor protein involved in Fe transport